MDIYLGFGVKLILGMVLLMVVIRFMGNKQMSELTPLDMIFVVVFSGLVAGISHTTELGWQHMIFALCFWTLLIWCVEKITHKHPKTEKIVQGEPKVIIKHGCVRIDVMEEENMTIQELETLLRHEGVWEIKDVELGILEISGKINCKLKKEE